jgi:phospholipid/cholesterol/gamma-HCH transport system substrate-binding protein
MNLAKIGYLGTSLFTRFRGGSVGKDVFGNQYFEEKAAIRGRRKRRWVIYAGPIEASTVPPEWHAWLHYTTDAPIPDNARRSWMKPHLPNRTGTPYSYRRLRRLDPGRIGVARRNAAEILAGLAVILAAAGFLAYALATSGSAGVPGYTLSAEFDRIDGLGIGSDVRMAGVKVGTVTGTTIDPKTYLAIVDFTVEKSLDLPTDSSATIASQSLLGGKYLALVPGGSDRMIKPGGRVTITQGSVSLEDLLGKFIFSVTDLVSSLKKTNPQADGSSGGSQ